jgi:histidinol-phosphatase
MPVSSDLYLAIKGEGALANGRLVRVSDVETLDSALISHGGLNQFTTTGMDNLLFEIGNRTYSQRGYADFGGYRTVMHGRADAMIDPGVQPWDICAPAVLIREAGGMLTSFEGEHTIYGGNALVSNGRIHDQLIEIIRGSVVRPSGDPGARKSEIP